MLHPLIGPFIFRVLGYLYQLVVSGQVPCLGLILPCRNFRLLPSCSIGWSSASLVRLLALHLDNSSAKAYLCNQGGTVSPFLSRLACQILSLTDKHGITLLPTYIPTHLNVEADFLSWDQMLLEWHLLPQVTQAAFQFWGLPEVDLLASSHSTQCQHYFTFGNSTASGGLGVECLQPSLEMLADVPQECPLVKDLIMDVSVGQTLKGLWYLHLTLLLLSNMCYTDRGSLPQSVRQWWGQLECLCQGSTSIAGRSGPGGVLDGVYQTMPSLPLN